MVRQIDTVILKHTYDLIPHQVINVNRTVGAIMGYFPAADCSEAWKRVKVQQLTEAVSKY